MYDDDDDVDGRQMTESSVSLNTSSSEVPSFDKSGFDRSHSRVSFDRSVSFLELVADTDHLWKRKSTSITNIGHVDRLGRWENSLFSNFFFNNLNIFVHSESDLKDYMFVHSDSDKKVQLYLHSYENYSEQGEHFFCSI